MTYSPSRKVLDRPEVGFVLVEVREDGSTVKPSTGSVTTAPIAAPRPSVEASRKP